MVEGSWATTVVVLFRLCRVGVVVLQFWYKKMLRGCAYVLVKSGSGEVVCGKTGDLVGTPALSGC